MSFSISIVFRTPSASHVGMSAMITLIGPAPCDPFRASHNYRTRASSRQCIARSKLGAITVQIRRCTYNRSKVSNEGCDGDGSIIDRKLQSRLK